MGNSHKKNKNINDGDKVNWKQSHFKQILYKDNNLEATLPLHSKVDYEKWAGSQSQNPASTSRYALNPIKNEYKESGMCGTGGNARIIYDGHPLPLEQQIENRQQLQYGNFKEDELWYLLWALSDVGRRFHQAGERVGDITPRHILMNGEGELKLIHHYSWPDNKVSYERALYEKEVGYVSPEDLKEITIGRDQPETNLETSDAFATGLTALDAALLSSSRPLYDKKLNFDFQALNGKRVNLSNEARYSNQLKHVILNLTEFQPEDRMTLIQLNNWLEPHSARIQNFQAFNIDAFPNKLHQTATINPISQRILDFGPNNSYNNNYQQEVTQNAVDSAVVGLVDGNQSRDNKAQVNQSGSRPVSFGQQIGGLNSEPIIVQDGQPITTNSEIKKGLTRSSRSQSQRKSPEHAQAVVQPSMTSSAEIPGRNTVSSNLREIPESYQQAHNIADHSAGIRMMQSSKIQHSNYHYTHHDNPNTNVNYDSRFIKDSYRTSDMPYASSSAPLGSDFSIRHPVSVSSSNFPKSPRSSSSNEQLLRLIEEKIKISRQRFPNP